METLEITKDNYTCIFNLQKQRAVRNNGGIICTIYKPSHYPNQDERYDRELQEAKDYQERICDALNTYNKTPILPSELLKINEELVGIAKLYLGDLQNGNVSQESENRIMQINQTLTENAVKQFNL